MGFYDKEISDLPIIGNLLLAAESVVSKVPQEKNLD